MTFTKTQADISNATFNATVNGTEVDVKNHTAFIVAVKVGTLTGSASITPKVQMKMSDGSWVDYKTGTAINAGNSVGFVEVTGIAGHAVRAVAVYGGSGSYAATYMETQYKTPVM